MTRLAILIVCLLSIGATTPTSAEDHFHPDDHLLFLTTFDDTVDVNLFGRDNDAGWIYTAESTKRVTTLMMNRCESVTIAKGEGKLRDCLRFAEKTRRVLFYQASPNLPLPKHNWSGSIAFWLKPNMTRLGPQASYPLQWCDGDWERGGFFLRFPNVSRGRFQFGVVTAKPEGGNPEAAGRLELGQLPAKSSRIVSIEYAPFASDKWTAVAFTFDGVNVDGPGVSTARLYLDGRLVGQISAPLRIEWMHPDQRNVEQDAAVFLGINYVGDIDDLRIYNKALMPREIQLLHQ